MRLILLILCLLATPVGAEEDPMELQRCIWRCLAGSPGAGSAQYNDCVQRLCVAPTPQTATPVPGPWQGGVASDNRRQFAGLSVPGSDLAFFYLCSRQGESYFALYGLDGPAAQMRFVIDTQPYLVPFDWVGGEFRVDIPVGAPFMNALAGGTGLRVLNSSGNPLMTLSLQGARAALQRAVDACFG